MTDWFGDPDLGGVPVDDPVLGGDSPSKDDPVAAAAYGMRDGDIEAFGALTLAQSESSEECAYSQDYGSAESGADPASDHGSDSNADPDADSNSDTDADASSKTSTESVIAILEELLPGLLTLVGWSPSPDLQGELAILDGVKCLYQHPMINAILSMPLSPYPDLMERIYIKRSDTKKHLKSSVYHKFTGRELEGSLVALMDEGAASPASFHLGYVDHVYRFGNLRSELRILVATGEMRTVLPDQLLNVRWKDLLNMQDRVCEVHQLQAHLHQHPEMSPKTICDVLVQAEMLGLLRVLAKKIKKNLNVKTQEETQHIYAFKDLLEYLAQVKDKLRSTPQPPALKAACIENWDKTARSNRLQQLVGFFDLYDEVEEHITSVMSAASAADAGVVDSSSGSAAAAQAAGSGSSSSSAEAGRQLQQRGAEAPAPPEASAKLSYEPATPLQVIYAIVGIRPPPTSDLGDEAGDVAEAAAVPEAAAAPEAPAVPEAAAVPEAVAVAAAADPPTPAADAVQPAPPGVASPPPAAATEAELVPAAGGKPLGVAAATSGSSATAGSSGMSAATHVPPAELLAAAASVQLEAVAATSGSSAAAPTAGASSSSAATAADGASSSSAALAAGSSLDVGFGESALWSEGLVKSMPDNKTLAFKSGNKLITRGSIQPIPPEVPVRGLREFMRDFTLFKEVKVIPGVGGKEDEVIEEPSPGQANAWHLKPVRQLLNEGKSLRKDA